MIARATRFQHFSPWFSALRPFSSRNCAGFRGKSPFYCWFQVCRPPNIGVWWLFVAVVAAEKARENGSSPASAFGIDEKTHHCGASHRGIGGFASGYWAEYRCLDPQSVWNLLDPAHVSLLMRIGVNRLAGLQVLVEGGYHGTGDQLLLIPQDIERATH